MTVMQSDERVSVYGLKNCDSTRKALKELKEAGFDAHLIDVREAPMSPDFVTALTKLFGDVLLNRKSTTWRGLSDEHRNRPIAELLSDQPTLMKRPVVDSHNQTTLGWTPEVRAKWGLGAV